MTDMTNFRFTINDMSKEDLENMLDSAESQGLIAKMISSSGEFMLVPKDGKYEQCDISNWSLNNVAKIGSEVQEKGYVLYIDGDSMNLVLQKDK